MSTRILIRKPNTTIVRATLAEVMKTHQGGFGMAYAHANEITRQSGAMDFSQGVEPQLDAMAGLQDSVKEAKAIFAFSTAPWNEASKQPFPILMNKDKYVIVGFIGDGDYSKHAKGRTDNTPEYYAAMEFLKPKIYELVKATGGDPTKLVEMITEKTDELADGLGNGSACLLIADGSCPVIRSESHMGESTEWGWISALSPPPPAAPSKPAVLNLLGDNPNDVKPTLKLDLPSPAPGDTAKAVAQLEQVSVRTGEEINTKREETGNLLELVWAKPKATTHKPKDFYEHYHAERKNGGKGYVPNNWRDRPPVKVNKKWVGTKDFDHVAEVCDAPSKASLESSVSAAAISPPSSESTQTVNVGMTQVAAADKNRLLEDLQWKGYANTAGGRSADDIAKDETKRPSYFDLTGMSIHDLKAHTPESIAWLQTHHPSIANATIMELLRLLPARPASVAQQNPKPSVSSPATGKPTLQLAI